MASLDALAEDSEIIDLLATLFNNEFTQGAAAAAASHPHEQPPTTPGLLLPTLAAPSSTRKLCKEDGCLRKNVSKGFCIRHGGGKRCQVESCDKGAKQNGVRRGSASWKAVQTIPKPEACVGPMEGGGRALPKIATAQRYKGGIAGLMVEVHISSSMTLCTSGLLLLNQAH
ncbi:hypothetical protein H257_13810 [Aphanomyces astaci]|uniref:Uncharacterized protein n=1 Tax=Aphanomyces astaci TaxID=112090 RepID=W4FTC4_APHAT|nr:hypothetical protein H257_13810 [Aphanomyces astaci]ETV70712.1 hypothetical protein H257_13810 [Aphanomyces astaci]|eukprot:XP_009839776.1 hypothetical protein H257_13810 [Aphanomyces astaci]